MARIPARRHASGDPRGEVPRAHLRASKNSSRAWGRHTRPPSHPGRRSCHPTGTPRSSTATRSAGTRTAGCTAARSSSRPMICAWLMMSASISSKAFQRCAAPSPSRHAQHAAAQPGPEGRSRSGCTAGGAPGGHAAIAHAHTRVTERTLRLHMLRSHMHILVSLSGRCASTVRAVGQRGSASRAVPHLGIARGLLHAPHCNHGCSVAAAPGAPLPISPGRQPGRPASGPGSLNAGPVAVFPSF